MPTFSALDYNIKINAVDMSAMANRATLNTTVEELEDTAFVDTYRSRLGGLKDGSLQIDWNNDFAAAQVDALLWPLLGTVVAFEIKPTSAAASATNPRYAGSVLISQYSPFDATVGDLAKASTTFPTSGTILRYTT